MLIEIDPSKKLTKNALIAEIKSNILEKRKVDTHTHIDECGGFKVTKLVSEVEYYLEKTPHFTDWSVTGLDSEGIRHTFQMIGKSGTFGESRFYGRL